MAYKYYKAVTDDGGDVGTEISSGELNALFNTLTINERINGDDKFRKLYIESDETGVCYVGVSSEGDFDACLHASSGNSEVIGDLTGNEDRYGGANIVSATATDIIVEQGEWPLFRTGEYVIYDDTINDITNVVDNGNGTETITVGTAFSSAPAAGTILTSLLEMSLTAAVPSPLWRENKYLAGAAAVNSTNTVTLILAK